MLARVLSGLFRRPPRSATKRVVDARWGDVVDQARQALAAGDVASARHTLEHALACGCQSTEVRRLLGSVLGASGELERARVELDAVVRTDPEDAGAWCDLGNVHRLCGRLAEAEACYRQGLDHEPGNRELALNLANLEDEAGRAESALARLRPLVDYPAHPQAIKTLARILDRLGRFEEAKSVCASVLAQEPDHAPAHAALGTLVLKRDLQPRQALQHLDRAIALGEAGPDVWSNRGIALQDSGRLADAIAAYDTALRIDPGHLLAAFHRSLALLMLGDFARGWPDYELRLLSEGRPKPPWTLPVWDGQTLATGSLLVYGEQGIGDEIMFASCLPDVMARPHDVVIACNPKLESLFRRSFPRAKVVTLQRASETVADPALAGAAAMTAIGSLPRIFRNSRDDFPRHAGYLKADPALVEEYRDRLARLGDGPKIGFSWRGGTEQTRRAQRTLGAEHVKRILSVPGVRFVNLQYDSRGPEPGTEDAMAQNRFFHWPDALEDYDRTAALVCALDSIVSVCTSVIHLAGALDRPVLVMAPFSPEWRYGADGTSMPWYPSVHIARQAAPGDWESVVRAAQARLKALAADQRANVTQ